MNFADLILDLVDQYVEIFHNKVKHISNLVNVYFDYGYAHIVAISMSEFFEHIITMWHDRIFICLKYTVVRFTRPSILCITTLILKFSK